MIPQSVRVHLASPHMDAYREKVKDLVTGVDLKVLQDAYLSHHLPYWHSDEQAFGEMRP